ncbi:hypothetical protein G4X40_19950 [Rhodococcus sp. D2-41]|uniref:hypothetical protein n=1 Tax=Speluncibacter jeojiensis TaxID=2710754 RepID=UPI00240FB0F8|nr:hypothetical protein [Rhodococcus sp. D2-41]MDG3012417.1 hypothetical protein [Rhodococcus sp. D2-41]
MQHPAFTVERSDERTALLSLQQQAHIYGGTVPAATVAERRRRNKAARKSRRINRGH